MSDLIRAYDWATTPLGPIDAWPHSLRTALSIVLNAKHPMWLGWGPHNTFLYNDAYLQVLGPAKHPWALGRPAAEVWAEIWDFCGPLADRVFQQGEATFVDDVKLFMNRGHYLEETFYSFSYSPVVDENGIVSGLFCPSTEITAKILTTRRLATLSELTNRSLTEKTIAGACRTAAETLAKNSDDIPFAALYLATSDGKQLDLAEVVGEVASAIVPRTVVRATPTPWTLFDVVEHGHSARVETVSLPGLPLGVAQQPVREALVLPVRSSSDERPVGALIVGISPGRPLDRDYRTFFELVSHQVATAIRNAMAAEAEQRRLDAMAELDRAKTAFFSSISHEFRTPLTLMLGPTEDALAAPDESLRGEPLRSVYRNELRMLKLVNALLDFARIEAGQARASYERSDVAQLTRDIASAFEPAIARAGIAFEVHCAPLPLDTYVDRSMWEKLVLNLLSNALKFTFTGSIRVALRVVENAFELAVQDTGIGIAEVDLPRLFERFHRVQGAMARTHEGSGIGLALVEEIATMHGGTVAVESVVNRGTTFRVRIPAGRAHLDPAQILGEQQSTGSAHNTHAFVEEAMRWLDTDATAPTTSVPDTAVDEAQLLVVDDNADMRDYLQRTLNRRWLVRVANDGVEALAAARETRPALILTDIMMPRLDGFGLLRELKNDTALSTVPVIMLSARAGDEAKVEGLEAGADDYLVKPFSARELVARVAAHLQLARLRHDAERANRVKDEFLAMLGHELRNPLAPIVTALELLADAPGIERERTIIERQVKHLLRLVDDLLDVSRIARGKITLDRKLVRVADVIEKAVEQIRPLVTQRQQEIFVEMPEHDLVVDGDLTRLTQVVANLLTNGAKYSEPRQQIFLSATQEDRELAIRVRDQGIGISAEMLPRVFDLFTQERQAIDRRQGGLGLGLAIVHNLVTLHGGKVEAHSAGTGRGSEFVVRLPLPLH